MESQELKTEINYAQAAGELAEIAGIEDDEQQIQGKKFEWRSDISTWADCKTEMQKQLTGALKFIGHTKHTIKGKPQLINQNMQQLTFMQRVSFMKDDEKVIEVRCFGESIDKRKEETDKILSEYCWVYKILSNSKEYTVLSHEELSSQVYTLRGMNIRLSMPTEVSRQLSLKGFANVFVCQSAEPAIKSLTKDELVSFCKTRAFTLSSYLDSLYRHPNGKVYRHPSLYMTFRGAQLLSGEFEGYPLSSFIMGLAGTGKTIENECLDNIYQEGIFECANSKPKGLVPSFKESPASPGFIMSCNRVAIMDELMKMVEQASIGTRQNESVQNLLSQLNALLEHKFRVMGSGNSFIKAQATARCLFSTNPFSCKRTLADHTSVMDITVLSRMLPYCQDANHMDFIQGEKSGNTLKDNGEKSGNMYRVYNIINNNDISTDTSLTTFPLHVTTKFIDADDLLTITDGCQSFVIAPNFDELKKLYQTILNLVGTFKGGDKLKAIFAPRGLHHLACLLDGLVKMRCLFISHDPTFKIIKEDYEELEKLALFIVSTWNCDFSELGGES